MPGRALALVLVLAGPAVAGNGLQQDEASRYVALAAGFMQKARETGDGTFYGRARAAVERARALEPDSYEALRTWAWVLLGEHDFRGALAAADEARSRQPDDWWNYGTLTDAHVELGDYEGAIEAADRMAALRPGLPAYARIGFLRSLLGDRPGAIEILRRAVQVGTPRDADSLAWTLVHLGHEHFGGGELEAAARSYAQALGVVPEYHLALAGLARVRAAEGALGEAAELYGRAVARVPAPDLVAALGDVHAAAGEMALAERQYAVVEHEARVAAATGTTYGRQLVLFYADHDRRLDEALRLAEDEARRRGDIYTDDALAWARYKNGRLRAAKRASARALRLDTPDAMLHYHAGMIAAALARPEAAARHLGRALALNPHFDLLQAPLARAALDRTTTGIRIAGVRR